MTAPRWFFRFMYDRESAAWARRRNEPGHRELAKRLADDHANVVAPPGPVADLGCGPGAHSLALARRGYDVVGVDGSPRMVEGARTRAARHGGGAPRAAVTTSSAAPAPHEGSGSRGPDPRATGSTRRSTFTTSARRSVSRTRR